MWTGDFSPPLTGWRNRLREPSRQLVAKKSKPPRCRDRVVAPRCASAHFTACQLACGAGSWGVWPDLTEKVWRGSWSHRPGATSCYSGSLLRCWGGGRIKWCPSSLLERGPDSKSCGSSVGRTVPLRGPSLRLPPKATRRADGRREERNEGGVDERAEECSCCFKCTAAEAPNTVAQSSC